MNTQSKNYKDAVKLGESLIGKYAQSRMLTELTATGKQILCAPQKITAYEIVENFMEPTVMVTIGGESVYQDLLINISTVYEVIRESEISNRIVKELNASVCTATFPNSGIQKADLYSSRNTANKLVFHKSCAPVNDTFVETVLINLIK